MFFTCKKHPVTFHGLPQWLQSWSFGQLMAFLKSRCASWMELDGALGKMSGPWKDQEEQTQLWNPCSAAQSYSLLDHTCTCLIIYESGCKWCWRFSQNNTGCTVSLYLSVIHLCEEWTRKRHDWKNWKHYHLGYLGCCNVAKCCRYTTVKALDGTSAGNQGSWDDMSLCQSVSTSCLCSKRKLQVL